MAHEIRTHPDTPTPEEMQAFDVETVSTEGIEARRDEGLTLIEENLLTRDDVDVYVEFNEPDLPSETDIGTVCYRLVQLFGTPPFPEYLAGQDLGWRSEETFKYLLRVRGPDRETGETRRWLLTVHDWRAAIGISQAAWAEEPETRAVEVDPVDAIPLIALVTHLVGEPIPCTYDDKWY